MPENAVLGKEKRRLVKNVMAYAWERVCAVFDRRFVSSSRNSHSHNLDFDRI